MLSVWIPAGRGVDPLVPWDVTRDCAPSVTEIPLGEAPATFACVQDSVSPIDVTNGSSETLSLPEKSSVTPAPPELVVVDGVGGAGGAEVVVVTVTVTAGDDTLTVGPVTVVVGPVAVVVGPVAVVVAIVVVVDIDVTVVPVLGATRTVTVDRRIRVTVAAVRAQTRVVEISAHCPGRSLTVWVIAAAVATPAIASAPQTSNPTIRCFSRRRVMRRARRPPG